jgi:uncharacterized membrane protein YGL010W
MRSVHDWFASYSNDHQNPTNRLIHWICVPAILWSVIAAVWTIPVPMSIGKPGFWCGHVMAAVLTFSWRLSRRLGAAMIALFLALGLVTHFAYDALGPTRLLELAAAVFVVAGIGQVGGERIEGGRPWVVTVVVGRLIGPAGLVGKVMRRAGVAY